MTADGNRKASQAALTLDALFRHHAARMPDAPALFDAPDRKELTGDAPRHYTYAEADQMIGGIALLLREFGLTPGSVVAIQLPNIAESILAILAVQRAGMVPALLPLLWRRTECVTALSRARARAFITCGRVGDTNHGRLAIEIAAELFPIRVVCGFGSGLAEGIVSFDDLVPAIPPDALAPFIGPRAGSDEPTAVITFDLGLDGPVPVTRQHGHLLAAGRLIAEQAQMARGATILSTMPAATFAGLSAGLVAWLLNTGALALHLPFDPQILSAQIRGHNARTLVVPDAIVPALCEAGLLADSGTIASVVSVCRAPERLATAPVWREAGVTLVDVAAFGELALLAAARSARGRVAPGPLGPVRLADGCEVAHVALSAAGTIGIRGALAAPAADHADGAATGHVRATESGHVDTRWAGARIGDDTGFAVTAAPGGLAAVGGYRFTLPDLQRLIGTLDRDAVIAALPHALCGQRLAGHAAQPNGMRHSLSVIGVNPLVSDAFRERVAVSA